MSNTTKTHKAIGMLRHHFWGHYVADIVLRFDSAESVPTALEKLKLPEDRTYRGATGGEFKSEWVASHRDPRAIMVSAGGETLAEIESQLVSFGADKKKMNSMATSIDHGQQFAIEF